MRTPIESLVTRRASIAPSSINAERRTAEVIWSTGARVLRGFFERFYEELSLDPGHVRLDRLSSGNAPLLAAHDGGQLDAVIGVVESARLENGQGVARVRFAKDDETADRVWNKIEQHIIRNISVGYKVHKYEERAGGDEQIPVMRAVDWEPFELSVVPMGADAGATFRAANFPYHEEHTMEPTTTEPVEAERERTATIMRIVRTAHFEPALAEQLIADGSSVDAARALVLDRLIATQHESGGPRSGPTGIRDGGLAEDFRAAATDGLLLRAGILLAKPHAAARDLCATSIHEIARTCCSRAGLAHGNLSAERLIERAMTTSDFPSILQDGVAKAVRNGYETEPASHRDWVRPVPVKDFKTQYRPILGSAPALAQVIEHGEYTEGSMTDDTASYTIAKYGKIVALTWEVLVNDDLNAFLRVQPALGQAARRLEADAVYALFALAAATGPTMQDGIVLFHSTHGNLTGSAAFDATQLGAGRALLRKQTALGGGYLSLVPRYLVVPAEKETAAEQLLATATRQSVAGPTAVTPEWVARLQLVVEPRLASTAVYLFADSGQIDTLELGLLTENMDGPFLQEDREFIKDVIRYKVRHVFGAKFLDWRGAVKMPVT
jgi:phage major head subunit gpT-like protein